MIQTYQDINNYIADYDTYLCELHKLNDNCSHTNLKIMRGFQVFV